MHLNPHHDYSNHWVSRLLMLSTLWSELSQNTSAQRMLLNNWRKTWLTACEPPCWKTARLISSGRQPKVCLSVSLLCKVINQVPWETLSRKRSQMGFFAVGLIRGFTRWTCTAAPKGRFCEEVSKLTWPEKSIASAAAHRTGSPETCAGNSWLKASMPACAHLGPWTPPEGFQSWRPRVLAFPMNLRFHQVQLYHCNSL